MSTGGILGNASDGAHGESTCKLGLIGQRLADGACAINRNVEPGGGGGNEFKCRL